MKSDKLLLTTEELIDPVTEIHYAYHRSLSEITIEHTHNFYEIFLVTKGKALHVINNRENIIEEGSLILIRPSDTHFYRKYKSENCELINLAFPAATIEKLFDFFGEGFNYKMLLESDFPPEVKLSKIETNILTTRLQGVMLLSRGKKIQIKTEFRILLAEIISKYFNNIQTKVQEDLPAWLLQLKDQMEKKENFTAGIDKMHELSEKSPEHLSREFKKYFKITPTDFINNLRLNFAANLLGNSDESIYEIAMEAGFENLSHFYHLFKKHFQSSPKQFRAKHQKMIIPY